jgi:hypothetical protein
MSATKRHLEDLTEKHAYYRILSAEERSAYRHAVLDAAHALLTTDGCILTIGVLHSFYDELKAVDIWDPA